VRHGTETHRGQKTRGASSVIQGKRSPVRVVGTPIPREETVAHQGNETPTLVCENSMCRAGRERRAVVKKKGGYKTKRRGGKGGSPDLVNKEKKENPEKMGKKTAGGATSHIVRQPPYGGGMGRMGGGGRDRKSRDSRLTNHTQKEMTRWVKNQGKCRAKTKHEPTEKYPE